MPAGITAALALGSVNADVGAGEARKVAERRGGQDWDPFSARRAEQVVSPTERRLAVLPGDDRPLPTVDAYDRLLRRESS